MSWSAGNHTARDKAEAKEMAEEMFEAARRAYEGTPEGADIQAARERVMALVDAMALGEGEGVRVQAYGSHRTGNGGLRSASFTVSVSIDTLGK